MRLQINATLHYAIAETADIILAIEAAQTDDQILVEDLLLIDGSGPLRPIEGEDGIGQRTLALASGLFMATYQAVVEVTRQIPDMTQMALTRPSELPAFTIPYIWPSRYCQSDRFEDFVKREFSGLDDGRKIVAMADWIYDNIEYRIGSSDGSTTAVDVFVKRQGVCRDFAHLLASFARAADIPARLVSAYAWQLDPPDFHAVVEVWLDGAWRLVDATRLAPLDGLVRIAVGRDATDIAFLTIFGSAELQSQTIEVRRLDQV
jgi:transglutaminase-like putative cysteine protease